MYDELLKALRETDFSYGCPCGAEPLCKDKDCVIIQAADAIEELMRKCEQLPSADAVSVVRCKVCKHWIKSSFFKGKKGQILGQCDCNLLMRDADFFCKSGERKDDDNIS